MMEMEKNDGVVMEQECGYREDQGLFDEIMQDYECYTREYDDTLQRERED
jgi:hypothetical protein